jgi:hypothetical protein
MDLPPLPSRERVGERWEEMFYKTKDYSNIPTLSPTLPQQGGGVKTPVLHKS